LGLSGLIRKSSCFSASHTNLIRGVLAKSDRLTRGGKEKIAIAELFLSPINTGQGKFAKKRDLFTKIFSSLSFFSFIIKLELLFICIILILFFN
jgi:hypothetical protein